MIEVSVHCHSSWYVLQEMAEVEGDVEKAEGLRLELEDLEDRAKELDSRRTSTISAIRSVYNNYTVGCVTLNNASDYQTNGLYWTPNPCPFI